MAESPAACCEEWIAEIAERSNAVYLDVQYTALELLLELILPDMRNPPHSKAHSRLSIEPILASLNPSNFFSLYFVTKIICTCKRYEEWELLLYLIATPWCCGFAQCNQYYKLNHCFQI